MYTNCQLSNMKMSHRIGRFSSELCLISTRDGANFVLGTRTGFLVTCGMFLFYNFTINALHFFLLFRKPFCLSAMFISTGTSLQIVYWLPWNIAMNKLCKLCVKIYKFSAITQKSHIL